METIYEPLHLDKRSVLVWKVMNVPKVIFESLYSLTYLLNMAVEHICDVMFVWKAEPLCLEFCNFMHCRIFVRYLSCCY
jgi:hypothetical protein